MCFEPPRRPSGPLALALLAALALTPLGCGKKGDPMPAPRTIAQPVADLSVRQRGLEVALEFSHPKTTLAGLALPGLAEVAVYQVTKSAPGGVAPAISAPELTLAARPLLTLAGAELAGAISGDRLSVRFRLDPGALEPPTARFYAVRTLARGGELSPWSNVATLVPRPAPEPPGNLQVTARKAAIEVAWSAPSTPVAGYQVYRREATRSAYGAPLATLDAAATRYDDGAASYGQRYIYTVCALASKIPAVVESAPAGEREVDYQDRFAPAPPRALRALGGPNEARLLWEPSPDADVAGYVVFRADPEQEFRRATAEPVSGLAHVDTGLASGLVFRYRVAAIDRAGNLGEPGETVETRVP